jgi:hypothetical protein
VLLTPNATLTNTAFREATMATNKAKRSIHLAQHQPQPAAEALPVQAHVYRAVADLNSGFEKVIQDLRKLRKVPFFHSERLATMHNRLCGLRAEANQEFISSWVSVKPPIPGILINFAKQPNPRTYADSRLSAWVRVNPR